MPPRKRKSNPDRAAATAGPDQNPNIDPPKRKRGRPRKNPAPEPLPEFSPDLPQALVLASASEEDEIDEDYVPRKKSATPKKPGRQPAKKRATPEKDALETTADDDGSSTKKAALKRSAVRVSVENDETPTTNADAKESAPREKDNLVPQLSFEGTLQMSLPSNDQGQLSLNRDDRGRRMMKNENEVTQSFNNRTGVSKLLHSLGSIPPKTSFTPPNNIKTIDSGQFSDREDENLGQQIGTGYGPNRDNRTSTGNSIESGFRDPSLIQDYRSLMAAKHNVAYMGERHRIPRSESPVPAPNVAAAAYQLACLKQKSIPAVLPILAKLVAAGGYQGQRLQDLVAAGAFLDGRVLSLSGDVAALMAANAHSLSFLHAPQNRVTPQAHADATTRSKNIDVSETDEDQMDALGTGPVDAGHHHQARQMPPGLENHILSSASSNRPGDSTDSQHGQSGLGPGRLSPGARAIAGRLRVDKYEDVLQKPGAGLPADNVSLRGQPQASHGHAPSARSFFEVDDGGAQNAINSSRQAKRNSPGGAEPHAIPIEARQGPHHAVVGQASEDCQRNNTVSENNRKVQAAPSSTELPQRHSGTPVYAPILSRHFEQENVVSGQVVPKPLDQAAQSSTGVSIQNNQLSSNHQTQNTTMSGTKAPIRGRLQDPTGKKGELSAWEKYLLTDNGQLLLYGPCGKNNAHDNTRNVEYNNNKENMNIDMPSFSASKMTAPRPKKNAQRGDGSHGLGQQTTAQNHPNAPPVPQPVPGFAQGIPRSYDLMLTDALPTGPPTVFAA